MKATLQIASAALVTLEPGQDRTCLGSRLGRPRSEIALAVLGLEAGFETADAAVIGEQDILGDRLVRPRRGAKRAENGRTEAGTCGA